MESCKQHKSKVIKKEEFISTDTHIVVNAWNGISNKKKCTGKKNTLTIIQRNINRGNLQEILQTIARYKQILHDENYFFNYEWSLQDFTLPKNYKKFLDDGALWLAYAGGPSKNKPTIKREYADVPNYNEVLAYFKSMKYTDYLDTDHWKHFSNEARIHYNNKCVICNSREHLHIHHKTYKNLGRETFNDVICLCADCHKMVHHK
jgi:hypothetical protein